MQMLETIDIPKFGSYVHEPGQSSKQNGPRVRAANIEHVILADGEGISACPMVMGDLHS